MFHRWRMDSGRAGRKPVSEPVGRVAEMLQIEFTGETPELTDSYLEKMNKYIAENGE